MLMIFASKFLALPRGRLFRVITGSRWGGGMKTKVLEPGYKHPRKDSSVTQSLRTRLETNKVSKIVQCLYRLRV